MSKYVVKIEHRSTEGDPMAGIKYTDQYLVYANYNPYNRDGEPRAKFLSEDQSEAFKFHTRSAAEVIAATYGGKVVRLTPKT
jgi:hypothetical protein